MEKTQITQNVMNCSMLATRHHPRHRSRFASSWRIIEPVAGSATSSPVKGETILGM